MPWLRVVYIHNVNGMSEGKNINEQTFVQFNRTQIFNAKSVVFSGFFQIFLVEGKAVKNYSMPIVWYNM